MGKDKDKKKRDKKDKKKRKHKKDKKRKKLDYSSSDSESKLIMRILTNLLSFLAYPYSFTASVNIRCLLHIQKVNMPPSIQEMKGRIPQKVRMNLLTYPQN